MGSGVSSSPHMLGGRLNSPISPHRNPRACGRGCRGGCRDRRGIRLLRWKINSRASCLVRGWGTYVQRRFSCRCRTFCCYVPSPRPVTDLLRPGVAGSRPIFPYRPIQVLGSAFGHTRSDYPRIVTYPLFGSLPLLGGLVSPLWLDPVLFAASTDRT